MGSVPVSSFSFVSSACNLEEELEAKPRMVVPTPEDGENAVVVDDDVHSRMERAAVFAFITADDGALVFGLLR